MSDPVDGSARPGLPLSLQIHVSGIASAGGDASNAVCTRAVSKGLEAETAPLALA